ncbi:uncharacterized protein LOC109726358 [Ananas comosus]|uniref:Uncharacterized protein LOC109726358 n=1 Tax=Ananas comosus TaxID=4615 RepID=A0A6P5GUF6_ANACO|nr:uncharacterized protein LOC109726358 [Ananas comosus]
MAKVEEVVIVGGGIAGLATAVALQRVGRRDIVVLEGHSELRATGAAISIFPNGWYALSALGVAHKLEPYYLPFQISRITDLATGDTQELYFAGSAHRGEAGVRAMHGKALLEALAEELPPGTIRFCSKVVSIKSGGSSNFTSLHLEDGSIIRAKLLIGCDGVHSVVAQWLGLSAPISSGRSAVRGLAVFPEGHGLETVFRQYLGEGIRAGYVPLNSKEVYWFLINYSTSSEREIAGRPELILREVTENLARGFPSDYADVVRRSDPATLTWAPLSLRAPWAVLLRRAHLTLPTRIGANANAAAAATVAGDAFHAMTPDTAQGGSAALEDAVALARCVGADAGGGGAAAVGRYVAERRWRAAGLVAGAYVAGWVQQGGGGGARAGVWAWLVKWFRDWVFYRFIFPRILDAAWYNCGDLTPPL